MSERKTSMELREDLQRLIDEAQVLKNELPELRAQLSLKENRLRQLTGGGWTCGSELKSARERLDDAIRWEGDAKATRIVFTEAHRNSRDSEVVRKVTEKRIYVACRGDSRSTQYHKDGTPVGYGSPIDMEATFRGTKWEKELLS